MLLVFLSVIQNWCSIKDDYRTLVGLEGINVVEIANSIAKDGGDE